MLWLGQGGRFDGTNGTSARSFGGHIALTSASTFDIGMAAKLRNDGYGGSANAIDVTAADACSIDGELVTRGALNAGNGIGVVCESATLEAHAKLTASTSGDRAGSVSIDTTGVTTGEPPGPCSLDGHIKSSGASTFEATGKAGSVIVACGTTADVVETAVLESVGAGLEAEGSDIDFSSGGNATVSGKLLSSGPADGSSGAVRLEACGLTLAASGQLRTTGSFMTPVELTAHDALSVAGTISAGGASPTVTLRYLNSITVGGSISPAPTQIQDGTLMPCP